MARATKSRMPHHRLTIRADRRSALGGPVAELVVVGPGRLTYLWVGEPGKAALGTFSGKKVLRQLARTILQELGDE